MFIWDFIASQVMDEIIDWFYGKLVGFFSQIFTLMNGSVSTLFEMGWVNSVLLFFRYFAFALFSVGLIVGIFEFVIEYQTGSGNFKGFFMNVIKGFLAVGTFTIVPIELYRFCLTLETSMIKGITDTGGFMDLSSNIMNSLSGNDPLEIFSGGLIGGIGGVGNSIIAIVFIIMMCYCVVKVFFSALKRGGILIIQIAVGSLYMFSVPRGYMDGFTAWCKQIIGLCLTTFLQTILLTGGLVMLLEHPIIGIGVMLSAKEVPRVAGMFGLDTSAKTNIGGAVHTAQGAVALAKGIGKAVSVIV